MNTPAARPTAPLAVWAHNWVLCGALKLGPKKAFLPAAGRLYVRKDQMPEGERFRTKPQLAVEMLRRCAKSTQGPDLAIFDGAYAICTVVQPLTGPPDGEPRIDWLTRLRFDSRLCESAAPRQAGQRGRPRKWGRRLPAPKDAHCWPGPWPEGKAMVYGKMRPIRYKQVLCQWHPAGAHGRVHAFAFHVEGYKKPWYLVTSDLGLKAKQVVEFYAARFVQEDAHRDLKQQLGLGAGQGRLKSVVLRTLQLRLLAMTLLRVMGAALDLAHGESWFSRPPWYRHKKRGSLRDIKRVLRDATEEFSQLDWHAPTFENSAHGRLRRHRTPLPLRRAA